MPKFQPQQITRVREARAWELRVEGLIERKIADRLAEEGLGRITTQAVGALLRGVVARATAGLPDRIRAERVAQVDALAEIYREAMAAWKRSQGPSRLAREREDEEPAPPSSPPEGELPPPGGELPPALANRRVKGRKQTVQELRERDGEAIFLRVAIDALAEIRKVLGIDAPTKVKIGGLEGSPPVAVAVSSDAEAIRGLSTEQLRAMDRYFQEVTGAFQPSDLADMGRDG